MCEVETLKNIINESLECLCSISEGESRAKHSVDSVMFDGHSFCNVLSSHENLVNLVDLSKQQLCLSKLPLNCTCEANNNDQESYKHSVINIHQLDGN